VTQNSNILGPDWICFGSVGKTHGLKGAFFLKTDDNRSDWPGYLDIRLVNAQGTKPCKTLKSYVSSGLLALQLDALPTVELAQAARGSQLFVHRKEISILPNENLVTDMVGMAVQDESGKSWGKIISVLSFGAQQNIELEMPGRKETILFPYLEDFVVSENFQSKTMVIKYVAEFLEEDMVSK
jgi:16S rRNA processing protein RimM